MDKKTKEKMAAWLGVYPESKHHYDTMRMYDFVREACLHGDTVSADDLTSMLKIQKKNWTESMIENFVDENILLIEHLMDFYDFCINGINPDEQDKTYHAESLEDFIESAGDLNYYEIYELNNAINGDAETLDFFKVEDDGKLRTVTYTVMDVAYTFNISKVRKMTRWLEDNYMDGLDAESWYGFKYAMERAKDN